MSVTKLYICDGECLKERLNEIHSISFNEALCDGVVSYPLFDTEFNELRALQHNVSLELYITNTVQQLNTINKYQDIELVFGQDMFCMINMVGLLTFLEQTNFPGNITLRLVDEITLDIITIYNIDLGIYTDIYKNILINHEYYKGDCILELKKALSDYLLLQDENNEILKYIEEHLDDEDLLHTLLNRYSDYGLGDTQYLKMIDKVKSKMKD